MPKKHLIIESTDLSIAQKVVALLGCIAHEQRAQMEALIGAEGLSLLQLEILHNLAQAPHGRLTVGQLKAALIDDSPNVSRTLNKLAARALVRKRRSRQDQRSVHICITPAGHAAHHQADAKLLQLQTQLSPTELAELYALLQKF